MPDNMIKPEIEVAAEGGVGVDEKLGWSVDTSISLIDEDNISLPLSKLMLTGKPAIIVPVYYDCPSLCGINQNQLAAQLKKLELKAGKDFTVISFSINPEENNAMAHHTKESYWRLLKPAGYQKEMYNAGWRFTVAERDSIERLTQSTGFKYEKRGRDFAHAASVIFLSPKGKITRYLYGTQYSELDLKLALMEAAEGKIGSFTDHVLMYCYSFDPEQKRFSLISWRVMQIGSFATALFMITLIGLLWYKEKRKEGEISND